MELDETQQKIINTLYGPILVLSAAGTGKTTVLTERFIKLYENNIDVMQILCVTFSNKAANEISERIYKKLDNVSNLWIGTFHGICHKILRRELEQQFVIFDSNDQRDLIKKICKALEVNVQFKPATILGSISNAKNELHTPETYAETISSVYEETVAKVFIQYQKALNENNAFDFDDLLNEVVRLFERQPHTLKKYQEQFQYVSVDEYQDTNHTQYVLTQKLAENHHNICVVGDSDQNIYSWRGANIQNILSFEKHYPNAKIIKLEQNYRSTKTILLIANQVIENNINRRAKNLWTENVEGSPAIMYTAYDENDEASFLAEQLQKHDSKNDVVILYRTNAQSRAIEDVLIRRSIPYRIIGGIKFYLRKEIKDVLAYLRYIFNNDDTVSLERIKKLPAYKKFLEAKPSIKKEATPEIIIDDILKATKYREKLEKKATEEAVSRVENINELISVAKKFNNLSDFLVYTSLVADIDELDDTGDAVTLMTLHSAKGLEYPFVYMSGCEEGLLPHYRSQLENDMLEEERRLFYVGITRAKSKVAFTIAKKRMIFGETWHNEPSRFIKEISESLLDKIDFHNSNVWSESPKTVSPVSVYLVGDEVKHKRFGIGIVQNANGDDLIIRFQSGDKILSAKFAPLEKA